MTDKITLELTLNELKTLDKHIEYNEETKSVFDKIKYAYPLLKMTPQEQGDYAVVSYNDTTYYRLMDETTFFWYIKKGVDVGYPVPTLMMVTDAETEKLLEGLYYNHIEVKKETAQEPEEPNTFTPKEIKELIKEGLETCEDHPNENPLDYLTPKTPEETEESLKEAFREAQQTEKWKEIQKKIDDGYFNDFIFIDRPNLLDFLKDKLGYSTDSCYEIVDAISEWLPETQNASGSQNAYVESAVEGWNDAINTIREVTVV